MPETDQLDASRAAAGDLMAFERLYAAHLPKVYGLARRMAGSDHADEIAQDVFVRVWQKLGSFRGDSSFSTWLHRLAVNIVIERYRALGTARARFDDDEERFTHMATRERAPDLQMDLETAICALPDGARQIFVLHDVEGYKHHEIADMLGIAAGTSKAQLHRARMLLRKRLRAERKGPAACPETCRGEAGPHVPGAHTRPL